MKTSCRIAVLVCSCLFVCLGLTGAQSKSLLAQTPEPYNIVFILTDDQRAGDLAHMPNVQEHLVGQGTTFSRFTISFPLCCPSRATYLTGRYAHNHRTGFGGGLAAFFARSGAQRDTYATALNAAGYRTGYFGKYMNGYQQTRGKPAGWDDFYANVDRTVWSRCFNADGRGKKCHRSGNMDAFYGQRATSFVRGPGPFLAVYAPNAPHQNHNGPPPVPEQAIRQLGDPALPRGGSFNEADVSDKPGFIRTSSRLGDRKITEMARQHRARLGSLQVVDRYVGEMISSLADSGELDNTYFFFATDNGYHLGQHRMEAGKGTPYVEDVVFPLVVRGPGVPVDARNELVQNTDLAPTFAELAGVPAPVKADGRSFAAMLRGENLPWRDAALVEKRSDKGYYGLVTSDNETYVEWNGGFREYYDLDTDPHQLDNAHQTADTTRLAQLDATLAGLRDCAGEGCWATGDGP
jgi:arylsulfatase A-like enzyme